MILLIQGIAGSSTVWRVVMPARLEILEGTGHFLPWREPTAPCPSLRTSSTTTVHVPEERWRQLLTSAPPDDEEEEPPSEAPGNILGETHGRRELCQRQVAP